MGVEGSVGNAVIGHKRCLLARVHVPVFITRIASNYDMIEKDGEQLVVL